MVGTRNLVNYNPARITIIHECLDFSVAYCVRNGACAACWESPLNTYIAAMYFFFFVGDYRGHQWFPLN